VLIHLEWDIADKTLQSKLSKIGCDTVITCTNILQPRLDCIHLIEQQCSEKLTTWQIKYYLDLTPRSLNCKGIRLCFSPPMSVGIPFHSKQIWFFCRREKSVFFFFSKSRWKQHGQNVVFHFSGQYIIFFDI